MVLKFKRHKIVIRSRSNYCHVNKLKKQNNQIEDNIENEIKRNNENIYTIIDKFTSRFLL